MNTKETQKEPLRSGKTDIIRRVKDRNQTAKLASAVGGAVLALLPISAKAETQPLGISVGDDLPASLGYNPQLSKGVPKDRFDLFISGFENDGPDNIYGEAFKAESKPGSKDINIKALSKIVTVPGIPSAGIYFSVTNADGTIKHQVVYDGPISVDGNTKYALSICNDYPENVHPTKTGIKILLYNTGTTKGKNVLRVDDLDAENYCSAPVDTQESTIFQPEAIPEIEFELGGQMHKLRGIALYKEKLDQFAAQVNLDGIPYDRDASDPNNIKWKPENPIKGNTDFVQTEWLNAFTAVETQDGRKLIVGAIDAGNVKFIVFEPKVDPTTGSVILDEVPVTVEAVDPNAPPLDDDGDGVANEVDDCIGYTDADKVDTDGNGKSDTCEPKCIEYANEYAGQMTASDSLPCTSDLLSPGGPAEQLKDGSNLLWLGTKPILENDGTISAQTSSKLRYIHTTLVGTGDPEPARNVDLPDGYEASIQVYSGTAHVTGFDFLGAPVEVTVTPESGLADLGFVYGAEVGVEGSDYEITVGSEYQPCGVAVCGNQNPEPPAAEPAQTVETPAQAEATQTEPPVAQVELPTPQPEPVLVAEIPMPVTEPIAEPSPEPIAEPAPDVVENSPETFIIPPTDVTVSSPEAIVYTDIPAQNPDTPLVSPDTLPDTQPSVDTAADTLPAPDTPPAPDAPPESSEPTAEPATDVANADLGQDWQPGTDTESGEDSSQDAPPVKTDNGEGTDASVQNQDTGKPISTDASDTNQPNQPAEKTNGGGGSCSCAIEKPNNPSFLNTLAVLGATALAWASRRRKRIHEVLTSQH